MEFVVRFETIEDGSADESIASDDEEHDQMSEADLLVIMGKPVERFTEL